MLKFLGLVLLATAIGCAPTIKEVRVEVQKPCLTQAPPAPEHFVAIEGPQKLRGMDAEGKEVLGVGSVVTIESFIKFGEYVNAAQAWMADAYARCHVAK